MTTRDQLETLSRNLWWAWQPDVLDIFEQLNPDVFRQSGNNPTLALRHAEPLALASKALQRRVQEAYDRFQGYLATPGTHADTARTAYFCMEYGLHESLNLYSGGLGILAGDHVKAASDLGIDFAAIGLMLRDGYFQQRFNADGWQQEEYAELNPHDHPLELVRDRKGDVLRVTVHLGQTPIQLQAWRCLVGKSRLYLLDADLDENPQEHRSLTRKLYQGDRRIRLQQEIVLGIGGLRLLRAMSTAPEVYHMNEGHCAFLSLELLREQIAAGRTVEQAEAWVRQHCVFTTHTPVMAGHDRFEPELLIEQLSELREGLGLTEAELLAYGRVNPDDVQEWFTMTVLGLKLSRTANGVSQLNGEVARDQWAALYARPEAQQYAPIGAITNGVHLPTWTAPDAVAFARKHLGPWYHRAESEYWKKMEHVPDGDIWALRNALRRRLIRFAEQHAAQQSLQMPFALDDDALTICFARRFATYKRATLFFHDLDRVAKLFNTPERPLQMIFAGKAHPADDGGKRFIQQIVQLSQHEALRGKIVVLENYNMEVGRFLTSGADVWLNNPRRPMEASGTSGMKTNDHGGLNLSILDGWWPEGYDGVNGWSIGSDASATMAPDPVKQDDEDAAFLYDTLETSVLPEFYTRDAATNLPTAWIRRMRRAMGELPAAFSAERMVADYAEAMYGPDWDAE